MTKEPAAPRRSDATRAAILGAARERFAADGYERATIRAIARDAGIDPSMVMRYYGNKEGLFAAASDFDLRLSALDGVPAEGMGAALVRHFLGRWEAEDGLPALLRASATHEVAAERARRMFDEQLRPFALRVSPRPEEAAGRAALVSSQLIGLAFSRYVLRLAPAVGMAREELVGWLAPTVQRYLTGDAPEGE
ncbi:TetR/AcrR family transcriptional regulator [Streptomyces sp. NPDC001985]|uniref:TetR/AcrR family transcriptional regulator n=1 Tax=Streptomyces sp. NPDC001985 TaxID=3154406 RepID=UPI00331EE45E